VLYKFRIIIISAAYELLHKVSVNSLHGQLATCIYEPWLSDELTV